MKSRFLLLPACTLGLAAFLIAPPEPAHGFTLLGGNLSLTQRDVRVRNTFLDAGANQNQIPDDQFPGYFGADMALWKSIVEWGSGRHGTGLGDPLQPQLGSGQANFDPSWQGHAAGSGTTNDNIISPISSCGGSTLAFAETPISNGWRIRFCENITWKDGPGNDSGGFDIQEVGAHEFGHAIGIGHSSDNNATMRPSTSSGSEVGRSIHNDDIAAVQAIYGVKSNQKPEIFSVSGAVFITIIGTNFDATSNEVWFTKNTTTGDGTPIKVLNVGSTNGGTQISVSVPATAGPGDILVRIPGSASNGFRLSNAFPLDTSGPPPLAYCEPKVSSDICTPFVTSVGNPSLTDTNPFNVRGNDIIANQAGLLLYSLNGSSTLNFHNATLCIKAPFVRLLPPKNAGDDGSHFCGGTLRVNFNNRIQNGVDPGLVAGQQVNCQFIYRDPGIDQFNDGLTDGLLFFILP